MPRQTAYLELSDAIKIRASGWASRDLGVPFDSLLTLNLENAGFARAECHAVWRRVLQHMRRLHHRHTMPWIYLWVFEASSSNGLHVHCLLCRKRILTGPAYRAALVQMPPLRNASASDLKIQAFDQRKSWDNNMRDILTYFCKGIRPHHASYLDRDIEYQGIIPGKRWGRSRNLAGH